MYKIKPYYEYIQTELISFINHAPDQWQAKVLALLSFSVIYSFDEISAKTDLSQVYLLKALIASEDYGITIYNNDGWVLSKRLNADDLNDYLALDIADYDIGNDHRMKRLLDGLKIGKISNMTKEPILTEMEKKQSVDVVRANTSGSIFKTKSPSYLETLDGIDTERPVDGSGRKKTKEWNNDASLDFGRKMKEAIRKRIEETKGAQDDTNGTPIKKRRHGATPNQVKSEKLYIRLCVDYPEYEHYITRHHKKDPSYEMMLKVAKKIIEDYKEELREPEENDA